MSTPANDPIPSEPNATTELVTTDDTNTAVSATEPSTTVDSSSPTGTASAIVTASSAAITTVTGTETISSPFRASFTGVSEVTTNDGDEGGDTLTTIIVAVIIFNLFKTKLFRL